MKTLMVVNPVSGGKRAWKNYKLARKLLGKGYAEVISEYKGYLLEGEDLCSYNHFMVFGGDGTVNEVVNAIYRCGIQGAAITIVPAGSGNDFVKSLPQGKWMEFFPGVFYFHGGERYFINVVGTGIDAYTAYFAGEVKGRYLRGIPAYSYGLIKTMVGDRGTIYVEKTSMGVSGNLSLLAFGRGSYVGGGFYLLPHANVKKSTIAWLSADYISFGELLRNVHILFDGSILDFYKVEHGDAPLIEVSLKEPKIFQIDGEILKDIQEFTVSLAHIPVKVRWIRPLV